VAKIVCGGCGASLKIAEEWQVNIKCEYCGTVNRIACGTVTVQYSAARIINQIGELDSVRMPKKDNFSELYEKAKALIGKNNFFEANGLLNDILKSDPDQARAWFYKSLLPILEQRSVLYRGCNVNLDILVRFKKQAAIRKYLIECGLSWNQRRSFMRLYGSADFLHEQQLKFLRKAVETASAPERRKFFEQQLKIAIRRGKIKRRRKLMGKLLIALAGAAVVVVILILILR